MTQFASPYYNAVIKNIIIGFGTLFSNIKIPRLDSTGAVIQTVDVPLAYGPKEKWNVRTDQDASLENHVLTTIPRMSFEITGYNYDQSRMVNRNNKVQYKNGASNNTMNAPVPYDIQISLYALTKGTEDSLCIVEQILPLFTPEFTINFMAIPAMEIRQEVPIILNNVSAEDEWEGDFRTSRLVTHTFQFTAKANLYSGVKNTGVITHTNVDLDTQVLNGHENTYLATGNPVTHVITQDIWIP